MKTKIFSLLVVLWGAFSFGQTTVVNYQFNNNLNNDANITPPYLIYHSSGGQTKTAEYDDNWLKAQAGGDYLELTINTEDYSDNLVLSFRGKFSSWIGRGTWHITANTGAGGNWEGIGQMRLGSFLGSTEERYMSFDLPDTAAENPNLKIRIAVDYGWNLGDNLRLDDLKISHGTPKIKVYSNPGNVYVPHLSPASLALNTDFGTVQTTNATASRTIRVRNYQGTPGSKLTVHSIVVEGANPSDFAVSATSLTAVNVTSNNNDNSQFREFTVTFNPTADGIRTAEISLHSNAAPSPYTFTVLGVGASCSLERTSYASNNFSPGQQGLMSDASTSDLIFGAANPASTNSLNQLLWPDANLYSSANLSLMFRGTTVKTIQFGGANGIDVNNVKDVSLVFNLAAFTTTNKPFNLFSNWDTTDDPENGLNINSTVILSVQMPDLSWHDAVTVRGSDRDNRFYRYAFSEGTEYVATLGSPVTVDNTNDNKRRLIRLNVPASAGISNLKFRIRGKTENNNKLWLVDDVRVESNSAVYKVWDGQWKTSAGVPTSRPSLDEKALFESNFTVPNNLNLDACECEVNSGVVVEVPSNRYINLRGALRNNGEVKIYNNGNFLQIENEAENFGNIDVQKLFTFITPAAPHPNRQQYNYVSSPVVGGNLKDIYPGDPMTLYHSEATNKFYNSNGSNLQGRALAIKEPSKSAVSSSTVTGEFSGVPFNGVLNYPLSYTSGNANVNHGFNLVGNPYPSNLNIQNLYDANEGKIEATFYFWDNRGNTLFVQQGSEYQGDNYAKYNAVSGTGVGTGEAISGVTPVREPNQYVKVGTGFMVQAKSTAHGQTLDFNNSMRTSDNTGPSFFGKGEMKDRYWLNLETPSGISLMNAIVYFDRGSASLGIEDTEAGSGSDNIFTLVDDNPLSIDGRSTFVNDDVVTLGYKAFVSGEYAIALGKKEGIFANGQKIYLKDKETGIITELTEGPYSFQTEAGEYTGRFEVIYVTDEVLTVDEDVKETLQVYRSANNFVVRGQSKITGLEMYDTSGRLIYQSTPNNTMTEINGEYLNNGVYILKITQKDKVTVKKVLK